MNIKKKVSVCVPVLNEESNLPLLYARLCAVADQLAEGYSFEFIFSDNQSSDESWLLINDLAKKDDRVKGLRFSRNVGFQRSILANFNFATGDAVIQIDADLQDPPELMVQFLDEWREGYDVVYGLRVSRDEGLITQGFRKFGYRVIAAFSDSQIPNDAGDFRLISRRVLQALLAMRLSKPFLRGNIAALGFKNKGVPYHRVNRSEGNSKFNLWSLIKLGLTGVINNSTLPLRLTSLFGFFTVGLTIIASIFYAGLKVFVPDLPQGLASIHILVLLGIGMNAFFLGIIGEYISIIYHSVRGDPLAIVVDHVNVDREKMVIL